MNIVLPTITVICLCALMAAKFLTAASLNSLRKRAAEIDTDVRKARGLAKAAKNATGVAGRGINSKSKKKKSLEKQIEKCRKELAELKN